MKGNRSGMTGASGRGIIISALALLLAADPVFGQFTSTSRPADDLGDLRQLLGKVMGEVIKPGAGEPSQGPPQPVSGSTVNPVTFESEAEAAAENAAPPATSRPADAVPLAPADVHVSPSGRVEMHVRDLDLGAVLQMLSIQSRRNIIASNAVTGTVTANLYGVTFEEALTAILAGNKCGWREQGNFIYVYTADEIKQMEAQNRRLSSRLFRLHYSRAVDVQAMIAPLLSEAGKVTITAAAEQGLATSAEQAGGNSSASDDAILVLDYPERITQIEKAIQEIDSRPKQVLIEATVLRAQLNEDNALGIDFNLVGGVDFRNVGAVSDPAVTNIVTGPLPTAELDYSTFTTRTDFAATVPNGGFTFGLIKNNVGVFLRALEQVTDTTVLANPKILAMNKQRGEVIVGRRDGYLTTTVTETAAVQNVEFLETGTQLIFRPFIGDDGYVRMEVHPKDSTGGLTAANLPFEQTTEVTTNVLVRDGHTILIGGLFREVTTANRGQVPIAGNVPIAGALFRNSRDNTQREEVIVLLTVHIIKNDEVYAAHGEEMKQDVERYRVGMRHGLQWFGRERLAQAHYQWATEHLEKGHRGRALWDLSLAINNNPKFVPAMRLKEKLENERKWDEDASMIRGFLSRAISEDVGSLQPLFGRPATEELPLLQGGYDDNAPPPPAAPPVEVENKSSTEGGAQ